MKKDKEKAKYNRSNITKRLQAFCDDGIDVYYSAYFFRGKQRDIIINRLPFSRIESLATHVKLELPDDVRVEVFDGKDAENVHWANEYTLKDKNSSETTIETPKPAFNGLGEIEINNLVDQRLREQKRLDDFERLKIENVELTTELEDQRELLEELEQENEQLRNELESKKQVRYYAGMLGDILEGIGISKDKIRSPIASLMGITENDKPTEVSQSSQQHNDTSGIVEDEEPISPEQKKRAEVISLMNDYLNSTDNQTLANLFTIFSEIESNPTKAIDVLTFINTNK
jgi:FtsZ-binding cell division protein ZapB